jgi:hypothetical protein
MSHAMATQILADLDKVAALRTARSGDAAQSARVKALKAFQAGRFSNTYADLLASPRYQGAAQFFLDELYGPQEFAERDAQFARVVPAMVRMFPHDVVATVADLGQLHALSESLDDTAARQLPNAQPQACDYVRAWQATGRPADRERQISLTLSIGQALDGLTRKRLLRGSLRLMRGPAEAAGLADLQRFLEAGFDAFAAMKGASDFLAWVGDRERALAAALFAPDAAQCIGQGPLQQLPR